MSNKNKYNSPNKIYYSGISNGKRVSEIWAPSPRLDPDGDNIVQPTTTGLIYENKGPIGDKSFAPFFDTTISIMKKVMIIMVITTGAVGAWYGTFGCKSSFLLTTQIWSTQFIIFLVILINIWIVDAESSYGSGESTWTGWSILGATITWLFLNIIAKIGDTWLFFDSPFWPGPLTFWGATMLLGVAIYAIDLQREFWEKTISKENTRNRLEKVNLYTNIETALTILFLAITGWRFGDEWLMQRNKQGKKFKFFNFFLGKNTRDREVSKEGKIINEGRCKKDVKRKIGNEIDAGIKNSEWYKFKRSLLK